MASISGKSIVIKKSSKTSLGCPDPSLTEKTKGKIENCQINENSDNFQSCEKIDSKNKMPFPLFY